MHPTVKCGRFFFLAVNNVEETIGVWPAQHPVAKKIRHLSPFLKKLSSRFLFVVDSQKEIKLTANSINRLLTAAERNVPALFIQTLLRKREINSHLIRL